MQYLVDGLTRTDGYIRSSLNESSEEKLYEGIEFSYRPATRRETTTLDAKVSIALKNQDIDPECAYKAELLACQFVADHLTDWTVKAAGIRDVPVSLDAVTRLHPLLFSKVYSVIRGTRVSDAKPPAHTPPPSDADVLGNSKAACG